MARGGVAGLLQRHACAAVKGTVGHLSERILQCAIAAELRRAGIDVQEQVTVPVFHGRRIVGYNRLDMLLHVDDRPVILELKRLRQGLRDAAPGTRLRVLTQAHAYRACLKRVFPDTKDLACYIVNVFRDGDAERVEVVPVPARRLK